LVDEFGNSYAICAGKTSIGRDPACGVSLHWEPSVSRLHAEVDAGPDGLALRDMGSASGTKLNGVPVSGDPVPLREGDVVECGKARLKVRA